MKRPALSLPRMLCGSKDYVLSLNGCSRAVKLNDEQESVSSHTGRVAPKSKRNLFPRNTQALESNPLFFLYLSLARPTPLRISSTEIEVKLLVMRWCHFKKKIIRVRSSGSPSRSLIMSWLWMCRVCDQVPFDRGDMRTRDITTRHAG